MTRRQLKKLVTLQMAITKKRSSGFFQEKIGVTPSVAAPGDTNPSDATECDWIENRRQISHFFTPDNNYRRVGEMSN